MRIGIIGSGLMGSKLGTIFARAGHEVIFSYARSQQKLSKLAREAKGNARPGLPREAAQEADALMLAVHWSRIGDVLNQTGDLSGKVIVTCSLPMNNDKYGELFLFVDAKIGVVEVEQAKQVAQRRAVHRYVGIAKPGDCVWQIVAAAGRDRGQAPVAFDKLHDRNMI